MKKFFAAIVNSIKKLGGRNNSEQSPENPAQIKAEERKDDNQRHSRHFSNHSKLTKNPKNDKIASQQEDGPKIIYEYSENYPQERKKSNLPSFKCHGDKEPDQIQNDETFRTPQKKKPEDQQQGPKIIYYDSYEDNQLKDEYQASLQQEKSNQIIVQESQRVSERQQKQCQHQEQKEIGKEKIFKFQLTQNQKRQMQKIARMFDFENEELQPENQHKVYALQFQHSFVKKHVDKHVNFYIKSNDFLTKGNISYSESVVLDLSHNLLSSPDFDDIIPFENHFSIEEDFVKHLASKLCHNLVHQKTNSLLFNIGTYQIGKSSLMLGTQASPGILQCILENLPKCKLITFEVYKNKIYQIGNNLKPVELTPRVEYLLEFTNLHPSIVTQQTTREEIKKYLPEPNMKRKVQNFFAVIEYNGVKLMLADFKSLCEVRDQWNKLWLDINPSYKWIADYMVNPNPELTFNYATNKVLWVMSFFLKSGYDVNVAAHLAYKQCQGSSQTLKYLTDIQKYRPPKLFKVLASHPKREIGEPKTRRGKKVCINEEKKVPRHIQEMRHNNHIPIQKLEEEKEKMRQILMQKQIKPKKSQKSQGDITDLNANNKQSEQKYRKQMPSKDTDEYYQDMYKLYQNNYKIKHLAEENLLQNRYQTDLKKNKKMKEYMQVRQQYFKTRQQQLSRIKISEVNPELAAEIRVYKNIQKNNRELEKRIAELEQGIKNKILYEEKKIEQLCNRQRQRLNKMRAETLYLEQKQAHLERNTRAKQLLIQRMMEKTSERENQKNAQIELRKENVCENNRENDEKEKLNFNIYRENARLKIDLRRTISEQPSKR